MAFSTCRVPFLKKKTNNQLKEVLNKTFWDKVFLDNTLSNISKRSYSKKNKKMNESTVEHKMYCVWWNCATYCTHA